MAILPIQNGPISQLLQNSQLGRRDPAVCRTQFSPSPQSTSIDLSMCCRCPMRFLYLYAIRPSDALWMSALLRGPQRLQGAFLPARRSGVGAINADGTYAAWASRTAFAKLKYHRVTLQNVMSSLPVVAAIFTRCPERSGPSDLSPPKRRAPAQPSEQNTHTLACGFFARALCPVRLPDHTHSLLIDNFTSDP